MYPTTNAGNGGEQTEKATGPATMSQPKFGRHDVIFPRTRLIQSLVLKFTRR